MTTRPALPAKPLANANPIDQKANNLQLFKTTLKDLLNISIAELKEAKANKAIEYDEIINAAKEKILENKKEKIKLVEKDTQAILDELDVFKTKVHAEITGTIEKSEQAKLKSLEQVNAAENTKTVYENLFLKTHTYFDLSNKNFKKKKGLRVS